MGGINSGKKSTFDKIMVAYFDNGPEVPLAEMGLEETEIQILIRYEHLDALRRTHFPYLNNKQLWNAYHKKFPDMSKRQFYYDLSNAEKIFGRVREINKEYERTLSIEFYETLATLCQQKGDLSSAIKAKKEADLLKGLYEDDEVTNADTGAVHVMHIQVTNRDGSKVDKIINLEDITSLPDDIVKEIAHNVDVPDSTPEDVALLLEK